MYLLSMSGMGDVDLRLVDKETWDWIHLPHPNFPDGKYSMDDPVVPDVVKQNLFKACFSKDRFDDEPARWEDVTINVTTGSCENDRMLQAYGYVGDTQCQFFSIKELNKFVKENGIEIVDEIEGCIY